MTTETAAPAPEATDTPASEQAPAAADTRRTPMSFEDALTAMAESRKTAKATPSEPDANAESKPEPTTLEDQDSGDGDASDVEEADAEDAEAGEDEEAEETEDETDEDAGDDDPVFKLADGSEVPLSELTKGYLRQADYTKKAQALSEQRKQAEATFGELTDAKKAYHEKAERYGTLIDSLAKLVDADADKWKDFDWKALKDDDPHEYLIKREEYREDQDKRRAVEAEATRLKDEQAKEHAKAIEQAQGALRASLSEMFPHWSDNTVLRAETGAMAETAKAIGFSQEEMAATLDPRAWQLLWKAAQYDSLQAAHKSAKNGERKPGKQPAADEPRPVRVLKASGPRPSPRTTGTAKVKALRERGMKTGSLEDNYAAYAASRRRA